MFGLKIITKKEYQKLLDCKAYYHDLKEALENAKKENAIIRKELEKYLHEEKARNVVDPSITAPEIPGHTVIAVGYRRCVACPDETDTCKKLYKEGYGTVCVEPINTKKKK